MEPIDALPNPGSSVSMCRHQAGFLIGTPDDNSRQVNKRVPKSDCISQGSAILGDALLLVNVQSRYLQCT